MANSFLVLLMILLPIIGLYLVISLIDFILYVFCAKKLKSYVLQQKYFNHPYFNQLTVVIYAHNNEKAVVSLLEKLNKQNYIKNNYQVHIILDNCTDNSSNILEFVGGAKIWRVGDNETLGKDAAISWVLERLISFQNVNAYVFIDVKCDIDENFLTNVNSALFDGDVLVGNTELVTNRNTLIANIKKAYNNYHNRVIKTGRRFLFNGLAVSVDSDITIIKQEVLEKIRCIDFQNTESELKYTTLLIKNGIIPKFAPNVTVYTDAEKYEFKKTRLKFRLNLFSHCISLLLTKNLKFIEHVFYLIRPNIWFMAFLLLGISVFTANYLYCSVLFEFLLKIILPVSVVSFLYATFSLAGLNKKELLYLLLFPFYNLLEFLNQFDFCKELTKKIFIPNNSVRVLEKFSSEVIVEGGQKNFKCKLDIIKDDGFTKSIFTFKKKKYKSALYPKAYEAINEIVEKLDEHGFRMKICQTCGYMCPNFTDSANDLKGNCNCNKSFDFEQEETNPEDTKESFLWNVCEKYIPKEINNVVDMSTYR